ncbi:MAG: SDR family NAD(P)-dependent oxidoreductase [Dehalococcoidales bacterium]|nr:SDR family NAD(P)-dependent oxidoreductase [Dehalococcoidales bacterium]
MAVPDLLQKDKVVVVTGARRGLGKAMALAFAEAGADIVVSDFVAADGEMAAVVDEVKKLGRRAIAVETDVTKQVQVEELMARAVKEFGKIDVLINNAGTGGAASVMNITEAEWDRVMDTNLKGTLFCSQAAGKTMMLQKSGNIINIASVGAYLKGTSPYAISKKSILSITQGFAAILGPYKVRVNAIAPGAVKTDMTRMFWENPKMLEHYVSEIPLGRMGEVRDIADVALFLASDAAKYVTGTSILVDGGILPANLPPRADFIRALRAESAKK